MSRPDSGQLANVGLVDPVEASEELAGRLGVDPLEWDDLALRTGSVLLSREWLGLWWRLHQRDRPLITLTARTGDGQLSALLPLVGVRPQVKLFRPLGQWPPAELSLIIDPADPGVAGAAIADQLDGRSDWASLQAMGVPTDLGFDPGGRGFFAYGTEPNRSSIFGAADWEAYLAGRSRNFRETVRRRERQLRRDFNVTFRRADDADRLDRDTAELFRLHRLRWPDSSVITPASEEFHRQVIRLAFDRGWLALWFLELDGRSAASVLGFRYGGSETFYQSGRDPVFETSQAGLALIVHAMRESADSGSREFRLLRGTEEYKRRLGDVDHPLASRMYGRGAVGTATVSALMARRALARH